MKPVYASKESMWLVVGDVLQRKWTQLMPNDGTVVDMDALVARIDTVYVQGGGENVLDDVIQESLDQLMAHKMIPERGEPWTTQG